LDTHYQSMYKNVAAMQHDFHNFTHQRAYDPSATLIRQKIHGLTDALAAGKSARTIDTHLKELEHHIRQTQLMNPAAAPGQSPILNYGQRNFLGKNLQSLRQNIRQHPHF